MLKAIRSLIRFLPLLTFLLLTPASSDAASLSDDLYSFQVLVGKDLIILPCTFERMRTAGWSYAGNEGELLRPEQRTVSSSWEKNGVLLSGEMVNTSWDVLPVKSCVLGAVELTQSAADVLLPGGIRLGTAFANEVVDAYGMPTSVYEGEDAFQYTYHLDYDQEAVFTFSASTGVMHGVSLRNVVMTAAPSPTALEGGPADYAYRAPDSMGDGPLSLTVSYGGALYRLPAPVAAFVHNGWALQDGADRAVKAYGSEQLTLSLNGLTWTTWVYNDSDKAALAADCLVTTVVADGRNSLPLLLPGSITVGTGEAEMLAAYGNLAHQVTETDTSRRYVFPAGGGQVTLSVSLPNGLVSRIEASSTP